MLKADGYQMVMLEQAQESEDYYSFKPQGKVCLVVGNEVEGVQDDIVEEMDGAIDIEMAGVKNSLNVTVAFGIAIYELRQKLKAIPT